jgi:hypothetical protein
VFDRGVAQGVAAAVCQAATEEDRAASG